MAHTIQPCERNGRCAIATRAVNNVTAEAGGGLLTRALTHGALVEQCKTLAGQIEDFGGEDLLSPDNCPFVVLRRAIQTTVELEVTNA